MKKQILSIVAMLSLLTALAVAGYASTTGTIEVNIPFDFMVGEKKLLAGSYTVDRTPQQGVLLIRSFERRVSVFAVTYGGQNSREPSRAKLVFHRYGDQYFLAQVWGEGSTVAMQLPTLRAERELAKRLKHLARKAVGPEIITVMAE